MLKVVYFDEGSATDFITIKNGGNLIEAAMDEKTTGNSMKGKGEAGVSVGKGIKKLLDMFFVEVDGGIKFSGELFRDKSKLIQSTLSNTILTDFTDLVKQQDENNKEILKLENYMVEIVEDSIAYFQRISPYLIMTDGKVDLDEEINININKLHDALKTGKGYYELLAIKNGTKKEEIVLRFNNAVFRNNYSVSDLDQMDLAFYGIKVGKMDKNLLNFENLMEKYSSKNNKEKEEGKDLVTDLKGELGIDEKENDNNKNTKPMLDVYDIILAGVE